jgi:oligopeptide/dipeptide ABC transporter ATP-binding protein
MASAKRPTRGNDEMTAAPPVPAPNPLLTIRDLRTVFPTEAGLARAVDGLTLAVLPGETLGVVGESGSGKSVTALSILRLIRPPGRIEAGSSITFGGTDLATCDAESLRAIRGRRIGMVFQEPMTALNPVFTVGSQVAEVVRVHEHTTRQAAWSRAVGMLEAVRIPAPAERAHQYPHELSGGTRQRVMLAIALVMHPALLIADEPTTALDVTVQAQILALLAELQQSLGMAMLLITHDLSIIAAVASRVVVMYGGQAVEEAPVTELFAAAHHPYTEGLLRAVPRPRLPGSPAARLAEIPGSVPPATAWPAGCRFHDRCPFAWDRCRHEMPPLYTISPTHASRCHLAAEPARRTAPAPTAGTPS